MKGLTQAHHRDGPKVPSKLDAYPGDEIHEVGILASQARKPCGAAGDEQHNLSTPAIAGG